MIQASFPADVFVLKAVRYLSTTVLLSFGDLFKSIKRGVPHQASARVAKCYLVFVSIGLIEFARGDTPMILHHALVERAHLTEKVEVQRLQFHC